MKVHKSDYIRYSRSLLNRLHKARCYGKGSMYETNLIKGIQKPDICKIVLNALVKQNICLRKRKEHGWKYYLNKDKLEKIMEIIKEKGRNSIIPMLLLL